MITPIKEILTPVAKVKIEIKDWITGGEAEYIDEALMAGVEVKPDIANKKVNFGKFDVKAINNEKHREIEKFIVSVDGAKNEIVRQVKGLPEEDYEFVLGAISERRKKKTIE